MTGRLSYAASPLMMNAFRDFSLQIWVNCVNFWSRERIADFEQQQLNLMKSGLGEEAGNIMREMYAEYQTRENILS